MFPGHDGETSDASETADHAAEGLRTLRRDIDRAIPRVGDFVEEHGRAQMRTDASRQRAASDTAEQLAQQLDRGPDGNPLAPDAARGVRDAREAMERGHGALEGGDPIEASRAQEEAARRLSEVRERMEQQAERESRGGSGGREGGTRDDFREPVHIPGAEEFVGPNELRRRLLDAMREGLPAGYDDAVRRYYDELLR